MRIHGKDEAEGENVKHVATKVFKDSLGIEVSPDDTDIIHRTGVKKQGKSRSILVKLKSHKMKVNIFKAKKVNRERLVEKDKMNITEDLTAETHKKLKEIRILTNDEKAWTVDGKINVKIRGKIKPLFIVHSVKEVREVKPEEDGDEDMD